MPIIHYPERVELRVPDCSLPTTGALVAIAVPYGGFWVVASRSGDRIRVHDETTAFLIILDMAGGSDE